MASFEFLAIILTGLGLTASLFYYARVLENTNKTRQTQLFMNIHDSHTSLPTMAITVELAYEWDWTDYDDFILKYNMPHNKEAHVKFMHYFASLERLGILIKKGLISPELVYDSQKGTIIHIWEKYLSINTEARVRLNAPQLYDDPEYLYDEMIRIRAERGHSSMKLHLVGK